MDKLLPSLGALSLGGGLVICLLALLSRLSRTRYAARWRCWVWVLLCLRLAVPMSLSLPGTGDVSAPIQLPTPNITEFFVSPPPTAVPTPDVSVPEDAPPTQGGPATSGSVTQPNVPAVPGTQKEPAVHLSPQQAAGILWAAGCAGMLGWFVLAHLRFVSYLRRWSRAVEDPGVIGLYNRTGDLLKLEKRPPIRLCPGLQVPMLAGILRPTLLLPEQGLSEGELRCSMLHELTHYKRRDLALKALALWVNAVHWFNPAVWYMVRLVERDMELACDEAALEVLPPEEHGMYGKTILEAVQRLGRRAPAGERRHP